MNSLGHICDMIRFLTSDNIQRIPNVRSLNEFEIYKQICRLKLITNISVMCQLGVEIRGQGLFLGKTIYREPETHLNARPFGSSMADWQRFGCLNTWP